MAIRFPALLFSVLGILGSASVLILVFVKVLAGGIPFVEGILISLGLWDAFVALVVITGILSILSLISGLTLRKGNRFGGFMGIITSILTVSLGLIGAYTELIPAGSQTTTFDFRLFYIGLLAIGVLMFISIATAYKEIRVK
jgi:hypothetical protein